MVFRKPFSNSVSLQEEKKEPEGETEKVNQNDTEANNNSLETPKELFNLPTISFSESFVKEEPHPHKPESSHESSQRQQVFSPTKPLNNQPMYCEFCNKSNHTTDKCWARQRSLQKVKTSSHQYQPGIHLAQQDTQQKPLFISDPPQKRAHPTLIQKDQTKVPSITSPADSNQAPKQQNLDQKKKFEILQKLQSITSSPTSTPNTRIHINSNLTGEKSRNIQRSASPSLSSLSSTTTTGSSDRKKIAQALKASSLLFQQGGLNETERKKLKLLILDHDARILSAVDGFETDGNISKLFLSMKTLVQQ